MSKKIISLAVAVLMVVAMLPTSVFFASAEGTEKCEYVFDNIGIGVPGYTKINTITSYEQTGNTWRFLNASPHAKNNSQLMNYYLSGDTRAVDQFIAFEINVPAGGIYAPEILHYKMKGEGGTGDVYLLPEGGLTNITEAKANGTKIASIDYSGDTTVGDVEAEMLVDAIELKEGTNVLLFVVTGTGAKATTGSVRDYFTYPYKLTLKPVKKPVERSYVFDNLALGVPGNTRIDTITSYEQTGNTWRFLNGSPHAKGSALCNYYLKGDTRAVDQFIAIEINVPADGIYAPRILHYKMKGEGGTGDVYLLPEGGLTNITEAKANGTKIASIDYSGDTTVGDVEAEMLVDAIQLKEGTNVLLFVVTGTGAKATTASVRDYFTYPYMLTLTPTEKKEDEELTAAFEVVTKELPGYIAPSVVSVIVDGEVIYPEKNSDGSYNIEAPKKNQAGENFLYWAKGLNAERRIISFSNRLENYIPDENGASILIAVYDDNGPETAEYYNANGQLIAKGEEPAKPSMAGYGTATAWKQYGEKNIYVAEYELASPAKDIDVTVVNGTGSGTYAYGDTVTCTADATKENFKCWTKTDINGKTEIVSVDKTYAFKVWENCTVTAVYEPHTYSGNKAKIVLDTFAIDDETGIMAEFIGLSDATEKGIMVGEQKIAMSKLGNQFTIVADKAGTYIGYAILKSGNVFYMITDGEVKVQ